MREAMKSSITIFEENPSNFMTRTYGAEDKRKLLKYMRRANVNAVAGLIYDCVTGEAQREEDIAFDDGEFMWTTQDMYHIEKYDAAVTDEFYAKAVA